MSKVLMMVLLVFSGALAADRGDDPFAPDIGSLHMCQIVKDRVDFYSEEIASNRWSHGVGFLQQKRDYFAETFKILQCQRFDRELS